MTVKGCRTRIIVGGVDLSGDTNTVGVNIQGRAIEYGVLQDCDQRRLPLPPQGSIEHSGYFTGPTAGKLEADLYTYLGTTTGVHVATIYDTSGAIPFAYVQDMAFNQRLAINAQVGNLITVAGNWPTLKSSGARLIRGYQVFGGAVTGTGAQTGIDFGAAGTAGGKLYVFVTSITGTATNASVKLQSDTNSDHSTTADEGTATFSAVGCQEVTLSATVNRYQRINVVGLGGATGFTFYAISCISAVTY
jgi:hypothetical protein